MNPGLRAETASSLKMRAGLHQQFRAASTNEIYTADAIAESAELAMDVRVFLEQLVLQSIWPLNILVLRACYGKRAALNMRTCLSLRHREENLTLAFQFTVTTVGLVSLGVFLSTTRAEAEARPQGLTEMFSFELIALFGGILFHRVAVALKYAYLAATDYHSVMGKDTHYNLLLDDQVMSGWVPLPLHLAEREVLSACTFFGEGTLEASLSFGSAQFAELLAMLTPSARLQVVRFASPEDERHAGSLTDQRCVTVPLPALALAFQLNARETVSSEGNWLFLGSIPVAGAAAFGPCCIRALAGIPILGLTWKDNVTAVGCIFCVMAMFFVCHNFLVATAIDLARRNHVLHLLAAIITKSRHRTDLLRYSTTGSVSHVRPVAASPVESPNIVGTPGLSVEVHVSRDSNVGTPDCLLASQPSSSGKRASASVQPSGMASRRKPPPLGRQMSVGVVSLPHDDSKPWWLLHERVPQPLLPAGQPLMLLTSPEQIVSWLLLYRVSRRFGARYFRRLNALTAACVLVLVLLMGHSFLRILFSTQLVLSLTFSVQLQVIALPLVVISAVIFKKGVSVNDAVEHLTRVLAVAQFDTHSQASRSGALLAKTSSVMTAASSVIASAVEDTPRLEGAVVGKPMSTDAAPNCEPSIQRAMYCAELIEAASSVLRTDAHVTIGGITASSSLMHTFVGLFFSLETSIFALVCFKLSIDFSLQQ